MINLINLLNTAIISASMGANLGIKDKPIYKASQTTNYNERLEYNNSAFSHTTYQEQIEIENLYNPDDHQTGTYTFTYNQRDQYSKYNYSKIGSNITIYETIYTETYRNENGTKYDGFYYSETPASEKKYNNAVYYIQINPHNTNINTTIHLNIRIDLYYYYNLYSLDGMKLEIKLYQSMDNDWLKYYNKTTYTTPIKDVQNDIESPQNGYAYNLVEDQLSLNVSEQGYRFYNIYETVNIDPTAPNYFMLFLTPKVTNYTLEQTRDYQYYSSAPGTDKWAWIQGANSGDIWYNPMNSYTEISGTNIIVTDNVEIIDLPGLMFDILTMPFTFVSMAFNLTLFPGTPYQINIANLFLSLLGIIVFVVLIKVLIRFKDV